MCIHFDFICILLKCLMDYSQSWLFIKFSLELNRHICFERRRKSENEGKKHTQTPNECIHLKRLCNFCKMNFNCPISIYQRIDFAAIVNSNFICCFAQFNLINWSIPLIIQCKMNAREINLNITCTLHTEPQCSSAHFTDQLCDNGRIMHTSQLY